MADIGSRWCRNIKNPPKEIRKWHRTLVEKKDTVQVFDISQDFSLWDALLHLCATSDEACRAVGFELYMKNPGPFLVEAGSQLAYSESAFGVSTLCKEIHHSIVRVLPKLHTPQSGITIRSLTHHVALCPAGDVKARWAPQFWGEGRQCLNLLVVPWPPRTSPANFRSVDVQNAVLPDMPDNFGFFEYEPPKNLHDPYKAVKGLLAHAHEVVDKVHGVIFPELALTPNELAKIRSYLVKKDIFLISGVREAPSSPRQGGRNYLSFDFPFLSKYFLHFEQTKHHRWRLDKRQIIQYGLGSALGVADSTGKGESRYWWEHIKIESRNLYFIALEDWCKRVE